MEPNSSQFQPLYPNLSDSQRTALAALLEGQTVNDAAALADVSRSTLFRWLKEPDFQAAMKAEKSEAFDNVGRKLLRLGNTAVDTLQTILDTSQNENVKVRAAVDSLTQLFKYSEIHDIAERLDELERKLGD